MGYVCGSLGGGPWQGQPSELWSKKKGVSAVKTPARRFCSGLDSVAENNLEGVCEVEG